jgi:hypothetical protein
VTRSRSRTTPMQATVTLIPRVEVLGYSWVGPTGNRTLMLGLEDRPGPFVAVRDFPLMPHISDVGGCRGLLLSTDIRPGGCQFDCQRSLDLQRFSQGLFNSSQSLV